MTAIDIGRALVALVAERAAAAARRGAFLVGLTGGVAVGKSSLARAVADGLARAEPGLPVEVVATDGFLWPNAELAKTGLAARKGFPETYDLEAFHRFLGDLSEGRAGVSPVYSHITYDIVPGETRRVPAAGVVIVEGVNVLQTAEARARLDLALYLDADPEHVKVWYLRRLDEIVARQPESFIAQIADPVRRAALVEAAWAQINLVNLRDHIAPTAAHADVVICKAADHALAEMSIRR
ncbi:MAG: hypothetical protein U1C74_33990 [Phenylobacterium sp.]|nr:hypothetical protein [Phenylobacterium sp.]